MSLFGFLCCHKPPGMTSRDVVNVVQRRLRHELNRRDIKVGHAGTLDPLAEGVLVIGVGSASRLVPYVQTFAKHYRATFWLGESTVSGDLEGERTSYPDLPRPSHDQIDRAATQLVGKIQQTPPAHSAIWVDGQRAYKRIRAGESFQMPKRTVEIHSLDVLRYEFPEVELDVVCGSGTYIRSLGIDLAIAAGSVAVMAHLIRLGIGPFKIENAATIDQLRSDDLETMILPATLGVEHLNKIEIDDGDSLRLGHGKPIEGPGGGGEPIDGDEAAAISPQGGLRAIVRWKESAWYPYRVFPTS